MFKDQLQFIRLYCNVHSGYTSQSIMSGNMTVHRKAWVDNFFLKNIVTLLGSWTSFSSTWPYFLSHFHLNYTLRRIQEAPIYISQIFFSLLGLAGLTDRFNCRISLMQINLYLSYIYIAVFRRALLTLFTPRSS